MLYMISQLSMPIEEAVNITGRKWANIPDNNFEFDSRKHDLNNDEFLRKCLLEVGNKTIPMPNVIRDEVTGITHSFDKMSTGVKVLWLLYHYPEKYLIETCFIGPNCYEILMDLSETKDIILYDNSNMLHDMNRYCKRGSVTDFVSKKAVSMDCASYFDMVDSMGY